MRWREVLKPKKKRLDDSEDANTKFVYPDQIANSLNVDRVHAAIDSSIQGDCTDLFTIYRDLISSDSHLQAELSKRKLAVIGDTFSIEAEDPDNQFPAEFIQDATANAENWMIGLAHLMDSCLYPVAVVEKIFRRSAKPSIRFELAELRPVDHNLIEFYQGKPHIRELNEAGYATGKLIEIDRARYIVHQGHLLSTPHQFGGPFRALVFWCLFTAMDRDWWIQFLDRFGSPFLVGKYDQNDDNSRRIMERAFSKAKKLFGLVVSNETQVEIAEASKSSSGDVYEKFLNVAQREKSKFILGQTLSASADATGMGSGVADLQGDVREDIKRFDASTLSHTIKLQLFTQIMRINSIPGETPEPIWGAVEAEEAEISGSLISALSKAGYQVTDEGLELLSKRVGFPLMRATPSTSGTVSPFSADSEPDAIKGQAASLQAVRRASADWARTRRNRSAEAAQIILTAETPEEAVIALTAAFSMPQSDAVDLATRVLTTAALNGIESA
ncbi:DUF935 family protein [Kiritimatiellaeota bacterium B1221]|nr:DUF935 family protein [Kiritimatiellaeota bacterium B1221]